MVELFRKLKKGLSKTGRSVWGALGSVLIPKNLDAAAIDRLEETLYNADFDVETLAEITEAVRTAYRKDPAMKGLEAAEIAAAVLRRILKGAEQTLSRPIPLSTPEVICLVGVNGSGKTTTTAKLAHHFQSQGRSVLIGACDTFRAAANEQLKVWAERLKTPVVTSHQGADASAVAYDSYEAAHRRKQSVLLLDTAGRLHTKGPLMEELRKLRRVLGKQNPDAPHHSWLILDGSLGSNSIEQARTFHKIFGITGLIFTKLDGTGRGGALVGIYRQLKLPIYFVGLGESLEDLKPFSIESYVNALFGLGDSKATGVVNTQNPKKR